jgi:hypothetical protein
MTRFRTLLCSLLAAAGLVLAGASADSAEPAFLSEFEDMPLMPGLVEETDRGMVFDSPSGRIVEAMASGAVTEDEVRSFYAATLPELGWEPAGDGIYRRESEVLQLEISAEGSDVAVKFSLAPVEGTAKRR